MMNHYDKSINICYFNEKNYKVISKIGLCPWIVIETYTEAGHVYCNQCK